MSGMHPTSSPRPAAWVVFLALTGLFAADLAAQGRPRFRRPRPAAATEPPPAAAEAKPEAKIESYTAITGGDVYTGTGQVLRRATVLIGDDKIVAVGPGIDIPEGATILDASGKAVSPGFVIPRAQNLGEGNTAEDPADSVNPFHPAMKMALAAGITSFLHSTGSGSDAPGGSSAVFKLSYGDVDGMVLAKNTVHSLNVPLSMAQMKALRDKVDKVKEYRQAKAAWDANPKKDPKAKEPEPQKGSEALMKVMAGEARLWIRGRRGMDNDRIREALAIADLLEVPVVLEDPITAWSIPDEIAARNAMVLLDPRQQVEPDPARPHTTGSNIATAQIMSEAGIPVAVHPPMGRFGGASIGTMGILGQDLNTPHVDAAYAVRGGLADHKALRTITLDSARMMGVADRVGSLEAGKDADVLILDGDPLHYRTFVETALVNGKVVYEKAKEPFYSHIER